MKVLLISTVLLLTFGISADLQAAEVRFQGGFNIVAKSGSCPDYDPIGGNGTVTFRPQLPNTDNGPGASFVWYDRRNTKGYRLQNGNFTTTLKPVDTLYTGAEWGSDDVSSAKVKFSQVVTVPAGGLQASTVFVDITGQVAGFDYQPNCTITFRMALFQLVDFP